MLKAKSKPSHEIKNRKTYPALLEDMPGFVKTRPLDTKEKPGGTKRTNKKIIPIPIPAQKPDEEMDKTE